MRTRLNLDPAVVRQARELAATVGAPIVEMAMTHTTVSVERAVLRLAGLQGADPDGMPWVNRLVDAVRESTGLEHGVALPAWDALLTGGHDSLAAVATQLHTAEEAYRLQKVRFDAGASTASDVLDAETDVARARLAAGNARYDYFLALVALARAVGDLPGTAH